MRILTIVLSLGLAGALSGCGIVYHSPQVNSLASQSSSKVRVVRMTPETVQVANRSAYQPQTLPAVFNQTAGYGPGLRSAGDAPDPVFDPRSREPLETRVPPALPDTPYRIGVGDVVLLATPRGSSTVEQLTGLLEAQNSRQGYTVQDDGAIAIPNVGRVQVAGQTLEEAEATLFQRLVENQIDPTFSLEISEFNSKKVSIGGAVASPKVVPIELTPLYLEEALAQAGGITVTDQDYASVRIYRDGTLYQIPLTELYSNRSLQRIKLTDGDSIFVDTAYDLDLANSYFQQQIALANFNRNARSVALNQLSSEISIRRSALAEERALFTSKLDLGAIQRDYVYLAGEVGTQSRFALPFEHQATLADALYGAGGLPNNRANARQIYVLRGSDDPREFDSLTAWQLNVENATNLILATRFQLRPNDIIFISEQPVTRWSRVLSQITPTIVSTTIAAVQD